MIKSCSEATYSVRHYLIMRSLFCFSLALTHILYGEFFLSMIETKVHAYQSFLPSFFPSLALLSYGLFIVSTIFVALNVKVRFFLILGVLTYLIYIKSPMDWLRWHDQNIPFWALLFFVLDSENHRLAWTYAPSSSERTSSFVPGLTYLSLSLMFMAAGINKLVESGLSWMDGRTLQYILVEYHLFKGADLGLWLVPHLKILSLASVALIAFQLFFPLSFFLKKLRPFFLTIVFVFFLMVFITTKINFFKYFWMVFLLYLPYDLGLRRGQGRSLDPTT